MCVVTQMCSCLEKLQEEWTAGRSAAPGGAERKRAELRWIKSLCDKNFHPGHSQGEWKTCQVFQIMQRKGGPSHMTGTQVGQGSFLAHRCGFCSDSGEAGSLG